MADYECYPLWEYDEDGLIGDLNPESLPISRELVDKINHWGEIFESTLCMDDPIKSVFETSEEEEKFRIIGETLAKDLRLELGDEYEVIYQI